MSESKECVECGEQYSPDEVAADEHGPVDSSWFCSLECEYAWSEEDEGGDHGFFRR
jgi:hypothetical protein